MQDPRTILITGASSGIGAALAHAYAAPGRRLALQGRDEARLNEVAEACRARGAEAETVTLDVRDGAALKAWIEAVDHRAPVDLVIANAGTGLGLPKPAELGEHTEAVFAINVQGVFDTVHPLVPRMAERRSGQIAIVSSIAGYFGIPGNLAYTASKAAVRNYGEGLRGYMARHGVGVSVISPGFVRSRLTARNRFPMPFLMDADRAAGIIRRGLARNRATIIFPLRMAALTLAIAALPVGLRSRLFQRAPAKD
ncbi:SDR family NAD(P)-dependent oxidoreductase [Oceanibacterium hippocampi]|uniref:Gluconate 5-dehydrogenase n=1 Tax=Oceanibacterium hippocampi TaxID=745714 RepID=A0A1Y5SYT7_9PROT|nr:SDR family NAD(P)-dependent oxidoreductase [Oceanibacterium hippocampi]SLN48260.1 Gluconate 5-dehydrogenase [Oceanibacterium hippocampi]